MTKEECSIETCEKVFDIIKRLQDENSYKPVTIAKIQTEWVKSNQRISYRQLERAFRELARQGKIHKESQGKYWIPNRKKLVQIETSLEECKKGIRELPNESNAFVWAFYRKVESILGDN